MASYCKKWFVIGLAIVLVLGSLLTFPGYLSWMVAVWSFLAITSMLRGKALYPWLLGCLSILCIKGPGFTPEFWFLAVLLVGVSAVHWLRNREAKAGELHSFERLTYAGLIIAGVSVFAAGRYFSSHQSEQLVANDRPIICLGDSLTRKGYPGELQELIDLHVIDMGADGITTDDGIKQLPRILLKDPQLVIIELGGHDYNGDHKSRGATLANLERLITKLKQNQIEVCLVEIPRGFITDPYNGMERQLARKYDLELVDDTAIRNFIYFGPFVPPGAWLNKHHRLSDDGLHPNQNGHRYFASVIANSLKRIYGSSIGK